MKIPSKAFAISVVVIIWCALWFVIGLKIGTTTQKTKRGNEVSTEIVQQADEIPTKRLVCIGEYKTTAYCACARCCGKWAENREGGIVYTASGKEAREGHTVAADTSILPFGTKVVINGIEYEVEDTGSAVKGKVIDIYFGNHDGAHQEALEYGVKYAMVYVYE